MKIFKKLTAIMLISMFSLMMSASAAPDKVTVTLDGKAINFEVDPQIINDRTMVPLRTFADALSASLLWNADDRSILLNLGETVVMLQIDNPKMFKNDSTIELDAPPVIVSDRTLVPVRAICETFGFTVDWNADERLVSLTSN